MKLWSNRVSVYQKQELSRLFKVQARCSVIAAANPIGGRILLIHLQMKYLQGLLWIVMPDPNPRRLANLEDRVPTDVGDDPLAAARQADPDKLSMQKALQKNFQKYMTFKKDYNELLLLLLRALVKDALHFEEIISGSTSRLTRVEAQEYEIYDMKPFFSSAHFRDNSFILDEGRGIIRHPLAE
ncbi:unnamed protein product [Miscanthus lutarioriparius]|uniref:DNA replication licensing factor MCM2-like winged-helix domain-containing protein n=1 Tax=Miscanthus lutarioriparius TaxID=422564 RepID=A0A811SKD9_9POAL|nr:unnamed protein product [Miscanthus lutarioriparius]